MTNGNQNSQAEELREELEAVDEQHGGGPETDRETRQRENFIALHGGDSQDAMNPEQNEPPAGSAGSSGTTTESVDASASTTATSGQSEH